MTRRSERKERSVGERRVMRREATVRDKGTEVASGSLTRLSPPVPYSFRSSRFLFLRVFFLHEVNEVSRR